MKIINYKDFPKHSAEEQSFGVITEDLAISVITFLEEQNLMSVCSKQLGLETRWFAMRGEPSFVCFNPKIVYSSDEQSFMEEACPSYPGLVVKIKRPSQVRVRFTVADGSVVTKIFSGFSARLAQHQIDKLNGIHFLSRANFLNKEISIKKLSKYKKRVK